jgi:hypothetical protein
MREKRMELTMLVLESEAIVGRILMLALRWVLFES